MSMCGWEQTSRAILSFSLFQIVYLDIEHEEFHPLAKWDDFITNPGRYLNGMIEGEFEE